MEQKDIRVVAIGGSSGGFKAVVECLGGFIRRKDVVFLVVLHGYAEAPALLAERLTNLIDMPVVYAENEMEIKGGNVFIAPPDHHIMVKEGAFLFTKGPKENLFRPSIDVLFRSVAVEYGHRAIGVLLSGRLNDGSLGLSAIKRCGGITLIQDPATAEYADMPLYAQRTVDPDFSVQLSNMPLFFNRILDDPLPPKKDVPEVLLREVSITGRIGSLVNGQNAKEKLGENMALSCPSCGGPLTQMENEKVAHYRCRIGHSFTNESLNEAQQEQMEGALWMALRVLDERLVLLKKMIDDYERKGLDMLAKSSQFKLEEVSRHTAQLKGLMGLNE